MPAETMTEPETKSVVTVNEAETILRKAEWKEDTIEALLATDPIPREVKVGSRLLIIKR